MMILAGTLLVGVGVLIGLRYSYNPPPTWLAASLGTSALGLGLILWGTL